MNDIVKASNGSEMQQNTTLEKSNDTIIDVQDVYKGFRVYYDKGSMLKERFVNPGRSRYEYRAILNGISFKLKKGETVALIGNNGCGKSTMLKMLTKIYYPNKGSIKIDGKVSSLIELGAGFHPDMSGRENIYINASILGLKKADVEKRIDDIIRFSELEEYIDNPIRTYSSGMYMRLAFSVAINVDAEILLIDEILAVGDQAFQEKCINKLNELRRSGVTVILVSHSMGQIKDIADRCIWIENGKVIADGDTETVCENYQKSMENRRIQRDEQERQEQLERQKEENRLKEAESEPQNAPVEEMIVKATHESERRDSLILWISFILIAIGSVAESIYGFNLNKDLYVFPELTWKMRMAMYLFSIISNVAVPLVLIFMGLGIKKIDITQKKNIINRIFNSVGCLLGTIVIYLLFAYLIGLNYNLNLNIKNLSEIVLGENRAIYSIYYIIPILIVLYLLLPCLKIIFDKIGYSVIRTILLLFGIVFFWFTSCDTVGQTIGGIDSLGSLPTIFYDFFYIALGYYISQSTTQVFNAKKEIAIAAIVMSISLILQFLFYAKGIDYVVDLTFVGVFILAFIIVDVVRNSKIAKYVEKTIAIVNPKYLVIFTLLHGIYVLAVSTFLFNQLQGLFLVKVAVAATVYILLCTIIYKLAEKTRSYANK